MKYKIFINPCLCFLLADAVLNLQELWNVGQSQIRPSALYTFNSRLSTKNTLSSDFKRDPRHLTRESAQLVNHRIDSRLERRHFTLNLNLDFSCQVTLCDGSSDSSNRSDLVCKIRTHSIHLNQENKHQQKETIQKRQTGEKDASKP